jgi:hypothetical protein
MQGGLIAIIWQNFAKVDEITMDEPHAGKFARVVLIEGEDKNPIEILQCVELCI